MKSLWSATRSLFSKSPNNDSRESDSTVYLIETTSGRYCGIIIYQDDVIIKLQCAKPKAVKILKANIERITIVRTEAAEQYWQWQREKTKSWKGITFPDSIM